MEKIPAVGRYFFAVALAASGLQQLLLMDFVRLVPRLPAWVPWPALWAALVGAVLLAAGAAIAAGWRLRLAAMTVGALLLGSFFLQRIPEIVANPTAGYVWTNPCKVLALWGGTLLLAGAPSGVLRGGFPSVPASGGPLLSPGPVCLAIFLLVGGVQHFVYAEFVQTLVPAWIPPSTRFWAGFTGTALIAGGTGILFRPTFRWSALLSGLMIFSWVLLVHVPRAWSRPHEAGETSAIFEALALSGVACLVVGGPGRRCDTK